MDLMATNWMTQANVLLDVVIALLLGGAIGLEREFADRPAGFRTHMLVAAAAALFVGLADVLLTRFTFEAYGEMLRTDPVRVVEAIVTGIAFLGAGTIFREQGSGVTGLTTAASILMASALGVAVALDQVLLAVGVTAITLIVLRLLHRFEERLPEKAR
jgi:putative Mg2+ transporter-C (MgtC) family protein